MAPKSPFEPGRKLRRACSHKCHISPLHEILVLWRRFGEPVQMCRFARALKSHFLSLKWWFGCHLWEQRYNLREQRRLASMHICTGSPEPSSVENVITVPKSRTGNLCVIYASSDGSVESAYLRRLAWAFGHSTMQQVQQSHVLAKMAI